MTITCGNCGKTILVPDDLAVGQHVRCPYCNEKSAFDRPTRIELPAGFETKRRARAKIDELKRGRDEQSRMADERKDEKPHLAIRRPTFEAKDREYKNAAAVAVNERIAKAESKQRRRRMKQSLGNLVSLVFLTAIAIGCYGVWRYLRTDRTPVVLPAAVTDFVTNAVAQVAPSQPDAQRVRREAEKIREEERAEREHLRLLRQAEEAQMTAARKKNAEIYDELERAFHDKRFAMADHRKILSALAVRTDVFYFCLPSAGEDVPLYSVTSSSNGVRCAVQYRENGDSSEEPLAAFTNRLESSDYLMAHGQQVCFRATRPHPMTGRINRSRDKEATELFFGSLYPAVKKMDLDFDNLKFEILLRVQNGKREIPVKVVDFGCACAIGDIHAAIEEAFPIKTAKEKKTIKKFHRTLFFWDGHLIKRGMKGETYVPRTFWYTDHYWRRYWGRYHAQYDRWKDLSRRVREEEAAEREYYETERRRIEKELASCDAQSRENWQKLVNDLATSGTLFYRARIEKTSLPDAP